MRPIALGLFATVLATTSVLGHEAKGPNGGRIVDAGTITLNWSRRAATWKSM